MKPGFNKSADGHLVNSVRVNEEKQSRFNPLRGWTPDVLVGQMNLYAKGRIGPLAWVMEWLEQHDDVIASVATKAKAAVSRWGYDVLLMDKIPPGMEQLAEDQRGACGAFFQSLETTDAVEQEEAGGMRLLVNQIMDAYGKGYAAHHVIWNPSRNGLTARMVKVPTWFFEVASGRMKFLQSIASWEGIDLDDLGGRSAWMISKGRGVMLAGVLARMFKQIPLQDWLTYCDRHGMPAFLGKTSAVKGSPGWVAMSDAVAGIGSEFGAVINQGDMIEVLNLTGPGEVPYAALVDRMDRAQVMLWRGGDLSTMSRANGTGSNPQQDEANQLDADNAEWVSETINRNLTARVIAWKFGKAAPVLCRLQIRTRPQTNLGLEMMLVESALNLGVPVSKSWFVSKFKIVEAREPGQAIGDAKPLSDPRQNP